MQCALVAQQLFGGIVRVSVTTAVIVSAAALCHANCTDWSVLTTQLDEVPSQAIGWWAGARQGEGPADSSSFDNFMNSSSLTACCI